MSKGKIIGAAVVWMALIIPATARGAELWIGGTTVDITPDQPVALDGQRGVRISKKPQTPIIATVVAIESRINGAASDQAVLVSCDLVGIRPGIIDLMRGKLKKLLPELDGSKLVMNATHTHTAPVTVEGRYTLPASGIMQPGEYGQWMTDRVAEAVVRAWRNRRPGKAGWGQGQAVVAQNRRALYADGAAKMYGATNVDNFRSIEGYEDHNLEVLFFWDAQDRLIATAVNLPTPAQEVESGRSINADLWHPVRELLQAKYGKDLLVLAWTGAGGDQTPHLMYGKAADERMRKLRGGLTRLEELARRIVRGWEDAYDGAQHDIRTDVEFQHKTRRISLPPRLVTEQEVADARREMAKYADDPANRWNYLWHQGVVVRYDAQKSAPPVPQPMDLHVLRIGDVAVTTNHFELFTDYGVQIKARSPAIQTFIIQLTGTGDTTIPGGYLPTERAVRGGSYSAIIQSNQIGPEGGQELVEQTLQTIRELWPKQK